MPDLDWNRSMWGGGYDWQGAGEEWSAPWGNSEAQWYGSLLPRIHRLFPARRVLEIAPGYGRWTRFLVAGCQTYVGIDLAPACVQACESRFAKLPHARFAANDGMDLAAAGDEAFDFVFSFDSLVHAEIEVFEAYIPQILSRLASHGVAFLHHSNLAGFDNPEGIWDHSRARSVSASKVAGLVEAAGGAILIQEIIDWHSAGPIDCLTTFCRAGSLKRSDAIRLTNLRFTQEAELVHRSQFHYTRISRT